MEEISLEIEEPEEVIVPPIVIPPIEDKYFECGNDFGCFD